MGLCCLFSGWGLPRTKLYLCPLGWNRDCNPFVSFPTVCSGAASMATLVPAPATPTLGWPWTRMQHSGPGPASSTVPVRPPHPPAGCNATGWPHAPSHGTTASGRPPAGNCAVHPRWQHPWLCRHARMYCICAAAAEFEGTTGSGRSICRAAANLDAGAAAVATRRWGTPLGTVWVWAGTPCRLAPNHTASPPDVRRDGWLPARPPAYLAYLACMQVDSYICGRGPSSRAMRVKHCGLEGNGGRCLLACGVMQVGATAPNGLRGRVRAAAAVAASTARRGQGHTSRQQPVPSCVQLGHQ